MINKIIKKNIILLIIGIFIILCFCAMSQSLWVDEVSSLNIVDQSLSTMFHSIKTDVHPPLYYIILKLLYYLGHNIIGLNSILVAKLISIIPTILMINLLLLKGKVWNLETGNTVFIFILCIFGMPNILNYSLEIRMYSWACFFVMAAYLYGLEFLLLKTNKAFINFIFFGISAVYTHYFACIATMLIFLLLFIVIENKRKFKLLCSAFIVSIAYLPWILIFLKQFNNVISDYWIGDITFKSIYDYFRFLFEPPMKTLHLDIILGVLLATLYTALFFYAIRKKGKTIKEVYILSGCAILFGTVLIGIGVSILVRPVFVSRYMLVAMGPFWYCFAYLFYLCKERRYLTNITFICLILVSSISIMQLIRWEYLRSNYYKNFKELTLEITNYDQIVTDSEHMKYCLEYYLDKDVELMSNYELIDCENESIPETKQESGRTWIFDMNKDKLSREILINAHIQYIGRYELEYYNFDVYNCE